MRILIIHNEYQEPGGEDAVVAQERALLEQTEQVATLNFHNRKGWRGVWQTGWSPWNVWAGRRVKQAIRQHRPDVIHIHNMHYAIGPIAIRIAKRRGIAVVMTLHNYRLLCPSATLFYDGRVFTDSLQAAFPWKAVRLGVHSHSVVKTFWLALTLWIHRRMGTWRQVDRYLALTDFAKALFVGSSFGVPENRFITKPNFVAVPATSLQPRGDHFLFIGRLTPEKGIAVLLEAFAGTDAQLRIAGDGPLRQRVEQAAGLHANITFLGPLGRLAIQQELATCTALVFPSIWYEGMPMTILEAFASGTPVIASELGAMQAMVQSDENGWLFAPGDALALRDCVARWLATYTGERRRLGIGARAAYERLYTASRNKDLLLACYQEAINTSKENRHIERVKTERIPRFARW